MVNKSKAGKSTARHWLVVAVLALAIYGIVPQLGGFEASLNKIGSAERNLIFLALVPFVVTYLAAAANYYFLALHSLKYGRTLLIQLAGMFVNRLLPAGIGAIGINFLYLRQNQHTVTQAGVVAGLNNSIGFVGHILLVMLAMMLSTQELPPLKFDAPDGLGLGIIIAVAVGLLLATVHYRTRRWLQKTLVTIYRQLMIYRRRPHKLLAALLSSAVLTLCHVATLWLCLQAVSADLSGLAILIVLALGVALGSAVPTPGGLGGVEAGLVAGFVAYGLSADVALAAVLIYRLITYWLALVVGAVAFVFCQRKGYIDWQSPDK
jgi:uncharacterized membrane protein YbhN (UPF0104 family)